LSKAEHHRRKLLLWGTGCCNAEEWRNFLIQTVIAERNGRYPLALAVLIISPDGSQVEKKLLDYLVEMPWVEAIWLKRGRYLYVVKNHFRWQVEDKVLQLTTDSDLFSPAQQAGTDSGRQQLVSLRCTYLLLLLNFVVFLIELIRGGSTNTTVLIELGAKYNPRLWMGEYWRLLTPLFLHAGWGHFLFNSLALLQLGTIVEKIFGQNRFLLIYFSAGLCGTIASVSLQPNTIAVGASGALFGLLGSLVYFSIRRPQAAKALFGRNLWVMLGVNLILGFVIPGIDYTSHLGGLLGGLLCAYALGLRRNDELPSRWLWRVLALVILIVSTINAVIPPTTAWHLPLEAGRNALEQGDLDKALPSLAESYRLNPRSGPTKKMLAAVYLEKGEQALVAEEWEVAVVNLEQCWQLQPGEIVVETLLVRAYLYRGYHRFNAGALAGAEEDCLKGIALNNRIEGFHYILGAVYYQQNRVAEAVKELEKVLTINPENQEAKALLEEVKNQE
jgi:membrane associated rhomboid family serine protease